MREDKKEKKERTNGYCDAQEKKRIKTNNRRDKRLNGNSSLMFNHFSFLISLMQCRFLSIRTSKREIIINSRCTRATRKKGTKGKRKSGVSVNFCNALFRRTPCSVSLHPQLPLPIPIPPLLIMTMQIYSSLLAFSRNFFRAIKVPRKGTSARPLAIVPCTEESN